MECDLCDAFSVFCGSFWLFCAPVLPKVMAAPVLSQIQLRYAVKNVYKQVRPLFSMRWRLKVAPSFRFEVSSDIDLTPSSSFFGERESIRMEV